jgi:hypothetical protein
MNCTEFTEVMHELLRPEQPASESVRRGLEHALLCDDCAAVLAEQRDLNDQLDDLADADRAVAAPTHIERNLLAALREQHPAPKSVAPIWRWVAALGLASAGVLVGAILIIHRPTDGPAGPAAQPAAPRGGASSMPLEAGRVKASDPAAAAGDADQAEVELASAGSQTQQAGQFYQIPYAFDGDSAQGDSVMRVELPASAIESLGLAPATDATSDTQDDDNSQLVSADVVVAEDGTLEAIRLAPQQNQNQDQNDSNASF